MRKIIKKVLREHTQIPSSIRRRVIFPDNIMEFIRKNLLKVLNPNNSTELMLNFAFKNTAYDLLEYNEDIDEQYDDYIDVIVKYLSDNYKEPSQEYLNNVIESLQDESDNHKYVFWKHSNINGGSGFKESFDSWEELIQKYGSWIPINWWEVKDELDTRDVGTIRISKPNENSMGYYFSIIKKIKE